MKCAALVLLSVASLFNRFGSADGCFVSAQIASSSAQTSGPSPDPAFEVATIRPSDPSDHDWGLGTKGNHFFAHDATVVDLVSFAYELHARQIVGGPAWYRNKKFDVEGVPDFEGRPSRLQLQSMLQKLLTDRFQLKFHKEKRDMSVYALLVAGGGIKLRKSDAPPDAGSGYSFSDTLPVAHMQVKHMTMAKFVSALQRVVSDRPIIEETGLTDRYDFDLQWTPDETQFNQIHGAGTSVSSVKEDANAPPGLFTAIQNQLGLKLEAKKTMADVIVIDRIEMPSAN